MEIQAKINFLRHQSLLSHLNDDDLQRIAADSNLLTFTKFQYVYLPDEKSECIYFLVKGCLKNGNFASDGREVIKDILMPTAIFGEMSLTGEKVRNDFSQSLSEESQVLCIKTASLQSLMHRNMSFVTDFMHHISQRLMKIEDRLSSLILKDARTRIIDFLVESANRDGKKVGYETLLKHRLTQQDIANITGTSRQTVTSVLNDLKKHNLIYFSRNSILIRDVKKLA